MYLYMHNKNNISNISEDARNLANKIDKLDGNLLILDSDDDDVGLVQNKNE